MPDAQAHPQPCVQRLESTQVSHHRFAETIRTAEHIKVVIPGRECNERTRNPFLLDSMRSGGFSRAQLRTIGVIACCQPGRHNWIGGCGLHATAIETPL
jgi:hypothetical protein